MLVFMLMASVFLPLASADGSDEGIDLAVTIKEPKPAIGISVDTDSIDFGEMMPGQTSDSHAVTVANIGLTAVDIDLSVSDSGDQDVFASGITANGAGWADYFASIATAPYPVNPETSFDVALTLPETILARGDFSGSMVVFATAVQDTVAPEADFSADVTSGVAPLTVSFTDLSTNSPTSWSWDFDNDGVEDSNVQNPSYAYTVDGTYTVSLTVGNSAGSDIEVKASYITVGSTPTGSTVHFLVEATTGSYYWISGTGVTLLDAWDDATSSTGHTYSLQTGDYEGQVGTIDGQSGAGMYWWKAFTGSASTDTWTIGPDGSGYDAGIVLANHQASEFQYVAFVYGNWETTGPSAPPLTFTG